MAGLPDDYADLFTRGLYGHLATIDATGRPAVEPVRLDADGDRVLVNLDADGEPAGNLHADPRVAVSVLDPGDPVRHATIRGTVVATTTDGAKAHAKRLAARYDGDDAHAWQFDAPAVTRVIVRIRPDSVSTHGYQRHTVEFEDP